MWIWMDGGFDYKERIDSIMPDPEPFDYFAYAIDKIRQYREKSSMYAGMAMSLERLLIAAGYDVPDPIEPEPEEPDNE